MNILPSMPSVTAAAIGVHNVVHMDKVTEDITGRGQRQHAPDNPARMALGMSREAGSPGP